ncbi:MAG: hypothetical protein HOO93_01285 [Methyloglobulus sp.]|mgnify:CR=1 FL=1|nr:hypothetical protein [Methyloglobulus sp.]
MKRNEIEGSEASFILDSTAFIEACYLQFIINAHKPEASELGNAKDKFIEIKAVGREGGQSLNRFMQ